jgi:hypothetical protein
VAHAVRYQAPVAPPYGRSGGLGPRDWPLTLLVSLRWRLPLLGGRWLLPLLSLLAAKHTA